ncbi:AsnC family transcriptional regulator [Arenicella chitinivorans]|uniref:Leucine-responsive regulatory protein n=1 Tax=Arenicella chitinivorans TaxID=1329800 RepID=A0A918RVP9_9GAMM|nr:Lrp/AsnC ligand binding domain-containing protein [Arenicella chitinivorans]GHA11126.1 AsnC family transcriptional regulator [Arenicella chitinivorans]
MEYSDEPNKLDKYDRRILAALQLDGRISYTDLGKKVGLTTTPCIERVRKLERAGYIEGYSARLSAKQLDAGLVVFVQISLDRSSKQTFEEFRLAIQNLDHVQECYLVTGSFDFLVKARVRDMRAYRDFLEEQLLAVPGVYGSTSIAAMETVKETLAIRV